MHSKTKLSAFSDADTQAAALNEWRQKHAKHKETASTLQRKVNQLKNDSEAVRKTAQWIQERDSLHREQEICENNLASLHFNCGELAQDADHDDRRAELAALKHLLLRQLGEVGALARGPSRLVGLLSVADARAERVARLREWIASEMKDTQALEEKLSSNTWHSSVASFSSDLDAAAGEARDTFAQLCETYRPSAELQGIFASTMTSTEDEAKMRLASVQHGTPATIEEGVLRMVCLIIKMGHHARQFSLSATTQAALADRVAALYPDMSHTQVQQAIDQGLSLRRAQATAKAALADYQRTIASVLSACESAFVVARAAEEERREREAAARQRNSEQASRHAHLAERRASYEAVLRHRRDAEEQRRSAAAKKADALQARRTAEFQQRLQLLQAYEEQRALLREKELALQAEKARAAEEEKAARMKHNEIRVDFRRKQEEQRRKEQKVQEEEVRALQAKKQQTLERFFAAVDRQLGVEVDPQRVLKATSSSAQTKSYETLAQATLTSITGFSDEQIMKDPRVRLYHALLAAGLHTTSYGREVVTRGYRVAPSQMSSENNPLRGQFS